MLNARIARFDVMDTVAFFGNLGWELNTRSVEQVPIHLVRLVVNNSKFSARIIFFSHTKPANSNNPRSYTTVSAQPNSLSVS